MPPMRKLLVIGALLVLLPACGGGGGSARPSADKLVEQTTTATAKVKSFHFVLDVEHAPINPGGLSIGHADGDVRVPGAMQARVAGTLSGIGLKSALVFVGGQYYLQDPFSGKWRTLDANTNPVKFFNPGKGVLAIIKEARDLTVAGSDKIGGTDCWRLSGKVPIRALTYVLGSPPSGKLVPVTIWLGKDDAVLRKVRLAGPVNKGDGPHVARSLVVSRLNERVDIKAPEVKKS
jgi:LppX_LprAFG lipoprotein